MKKFVKDWSQSYLISILQKTLDVGTCITYILTHSVTEALEIYSKGKMPYKYIEWTAEWSKPAGISLLEEVQAVTAWTSHQD